MQTKCMLFYYEYGWYHFLRGGQIHALYFKFIAYDDVFSKNKEAVILTAKARRIDIQLGLTNFIV